MRRKKILIIITSIKLFVLVLCVGIWFFGSQSKSKDTGKDTIVKEETVDDFLDEQHSDNEDINNDSTTSVLESDESSDNTKTPDEGSNKTEEKTTNHTHK